MKSFWVNTKGQPIVDSDGRLWSTAMVEDITQRRNKREILKNEKKNINMYYQYRFRLERLIDDQEHIPSPDFSTTTS
jgi:hypothetical protein